MANNNLVLTAIKDYVKQKLGAVSIDRVQLILMITWVWAWVGLRLSYVFEWIFKAMLQLPEIILCDLNPELLTSDGKNIRILDAISNNKLITKKLKLFLKYFWDTAGDDTAMDTNGFNLGKLMSFINNNTIQCRYEATNVANTDATNNTNQFNVIWEKTDAIYQEIIQRIDTGDMNNTDNADDANGMGIAKELPYGHVNFIANNEDYDVENVDDTLDELRDLIG